MRFARIRVWAIRRRRRSSNPVYQPPNRRPFSRNEWSEEIRQVTTVGADKGYNTAQFVGALERQGIRAHVARKVTGSAQSMDAPRVAKGYATSLRQRKMIEEALGWIKTVGGLRKTQHKGLEKLTS